MNERQHGFRVDTGYRCLLCQRDLAEHGIYHADPPPAVVYGQFPGLPQASGFVCRPCDSCGDIAPHDHCGICGEYRDGVLEDHECAGGFLTGPGFRA